MAGRVLVILWCRLNKFWYAGSLMLSGECVGVLVCWCINCRKGCEGWGLWVNTGMLCRFLPDLDLFVDYSFLHFYCCWFRKKTVDQTLGSIAERLANDVRIPGLFFSLAVFFTLDAHVDTKNWYLLDKFVFWLFATFLHHHHLLLQRITMSIWHNPRYSNCEGLGEMFLTICIYYLLFSKACLPSLSLTSSKEDTLPIAPKLILSSSINPPWDCSSPVSLLNTTQTAEVKMKYIYLVD